MSSKLIAFKVINEVLGGHKGRFVPKYFSANLILSTIKDYTKDPKLVKNSYAQIRRVLTKLGYGDGNIPSRKVVKL